MIVGIISFKSKCAMFHLVSKIWLYISLKQAFFTLLFFFIPIMATAYEVSFEGIDDPKTLTLVKSVSQLEKLQSEDLTPLRLRKRAESDVASIERALQSVGYYNSKVKLSFESNQKVTLKIETGPIFYFGSFQIEFYQNEELVCFEGFCRDELGIFIGEVALPSTIIKAEEGLLKQLNKQGYAFCSIKERKIQADIQENAILVDLKVELGPLSHFGPVRISGAERLHRAFFIKKLRWREGDLYDPMKIEKTQEAIELSGLFKSVHITYPEETPVSALEMQIDVLEAKQRSIGFGLSYTTEFGAGVMMEWEDRNIMGGGEKLSFQTNLFEKLQEGTLSYRIPDFMLQDQSLTWSLEYQHEHIKAYTDQSITLSSIIERIFNEQLRFSYGLAYRFLRSERSDRNGTFNLTKMPFQIRWSNADSLLDPSRGMTIQLKLVPTLQVTFPQFGYSINTLTTSIYKSFDKDKRRIFALKVMLGSIMGASENAIPTPERFLSGTENALRGYRYLTVSPLIHHGRKPAGGRSLAIASIEFRNRMGKNWGWVGFYEVGNVFKDPAPNFDHGVLQSAGIGIRYFTPVGPLRLDFAVPLNPRKHIDGPFQIYFSIGQSF